jgi:hypothetical protein
MVTGYGTDKQTCKWVKKIKEKGETWGIKIMQSDLNTPTVV